MTGTLHSWPRHVAVIMDGNGRWAKERGLSRIEGHRAGIESVREVIEQSRKLEISYLTLYTFSVENWKRPKSEIKDLMRLLYTYLATEMSRLHGQSVRLMAIGQVDRLSQRIRRRLRLIMKKTAVDYKLTVVLALSYGGRTEIVDAVKAVARERAESGDNTPLTVEKLSRRLYAPEIPPPDLLIRTSGEMRLSNFLLWESAHSHLWFAPELWPDFRGPQFLKVVSEARGRWADEETGQ